MIASRCRHLPWNDERLPLDGTGKHATGEEAPWSSNAWTVGASISQGTSGWRLAGGPSTLHPMSCVSAHAYVAETAGRRPQFQLRGRPRHGHLHQPAQPHDDPVSFSPPILLCPGPTRDCLMV